MHMPLPAGAGVGFKPRHFDAILADRTAPITFLEVHAENYMGAGGRPHAELAALRGRFALSVHGVGLSIGGEAPLDRTHLERLRTLIERYRPESFSEHLAWSSHGGAFFNDLLPLPYTPATLARVADHIAEVQDTLGRRMLLENPSTYIRFEESSIGEVDFLGTLVARTGCGLLLDVNNVFVSAVNHGVDARAAVSCWTSATSSSRPRTTGATHGPISRTFPMRRSARSISAVMTGIKTRRVRHCSSTPMAARWPTRYGHCSRKS